MEYKEYASKGTANTALGFSIAGTVLGLLSGGGALLGGLNPRGAGTCSEDHVINRYEAGQAARIAELETEVKLRDANTYTDGKMLQLYQYVDGRLRGVEGQIAQQAVYNATNNGLIGCLQQQVAQLQGLTKIVIPDTSVCPQPMPAKNAWVAPTNTPTTGG